MQSNGEDREQSANNCQVRENTTDMPEVSGRSNMLWKTPNTTTSLGRQNCVSSLDNLPVELILEVATFLTPVSQVSLSSCSKRLRGTLTNCLDLSFTDSDEKLTFLLRLQQELPEYLTCRRCVRMFKWRRMFDRKSQGACRYRCTRSHPLQSRTSSLGRAYDGAYPFLPVFLCECFEPNVVVTREIVDLIARAHLQGQHYGLSASHFNHQCRDPPPCYSSSVDRQIEGRLIQGHLVITRTISYTQTFFSLDAYRYPRWVYNPCPYIRSFYDDKHQLRLKRMSWTGQENPMLAAVKCEQCATDYTLEMLPTGQDDQWKVEMRIWQDCGDLGDLLRSHEQFDFPVPRWRCDKEPAEVRDSRYKFLRYIWNSSNGPIRGVERSVQEDC